MKDVDLEYQLKSNTFDMHIVGEDTLTIDFKDSTYTVFEYGVKNRPWRLSSFENNDFLVLDKTVIALKQINEHTLKGLLISNNDHEITLNKREIRWDKNGLNGVWIEENNVDYFYNDSIPKPPPLPPPTGLTENDFQDVPLYEIKGDSIFIKYEYITSKSKIDISHSLDFITMELRSDYDNVDKSWEIKTLNDSLMLVNRTVENRNKKFSFLSKTEVNTKLMKIK